MEIDRRILTSQNQFMQAAAERIPMFVQQSVQDVFQTMANLPTECLHHEQAGSPNVSVNGIAGSLSFAGRATGILYLILPETLASHLARTMLGGDTAIGAGEIADVVGELTNMITGGLKSRMADAGFNCVLSIPTLMRAQQVVVHVKDTKIVVGHNFRVPSLNEQFTVRAFVRLD